MRKLYFLLPGTDNKFACGGLWAELKTLELARNICNADVVTYRQRESGKLFLDDILSEKQEDTIFVMSWGFDISRLVSKLRGQNVVYHAHSAGYKFNLPPDIPIITVSRNTLGYWGQLAPNSLIYYLPNQISEEFQNLHLPRDIDILVQARKSSTYLLKMLVPALQKKYQVFVVNSYIPDLPGLFNRAKVYLYDSAEYWAQQSVSEGFGLQPMEAMACGCHVFSSVNGGLSDYLDPGFNCQKIAGYSLEYDMQRISVALNRENKITFPEHFLAEYRQKNIIDKMQVILQELNEFFDHRQKYTSNIPQLTPMRLAQLQIQRVFSKVKKKMNR
ncbi:glycosyltransferase [Calothrix sp. 336/3]|uniref:glycosyltransferase n=1 Tax=Calothrix sp. 336/3 TaxID=1337936 RepID=UPI0004E43086|nr:glycosyltransferase [Calothrix sp. 336/3]AKG20549.1 glycosyltransferase [Calothrix sp. 336/3]